MPLAIRRAMARQRVLMPIVVPPGGFAGFAQQTPATQNLFQRAGRIGGKTTQRRRRKKNGTAKRRTSRRASSRPTMRSRKRNGRARLVKGSAAAKAYMAKIRRKRK
jgi:hypothetical protein